MHKNFMQYLRSARVLTSQLPLHRAGERTNERTLCTRTYTKYDKSNACNFKLFGSATVIYSIFSASRAPNLSRFAHSEIPQKPVYA